MKGQTETDNVRVVPTIIKNKWLYWQFKAWKGSQINPLSGALLSGSPLPLTSKIIK